MKRYIQLKENKQITLSTPFDIWLKSIIGVGGIKGIKLLAERYSTVVFSGAYKSDIIGTRFETDAYYDIQEEWEDLGDIDYETEEWINPDYNYKLKRNRKRLDKGVFDKAYEYFYDEMKDEYEALLKSYSNEYKFPMSVFRSLYLPHDSVDSLLKDRKLMNRLVKEIGVYWAKTRKEAYSYWHETGKTNENNFIFEAMIKENDINWSRTLDYNLHPELSEEKEVRLNKNTKIQVTNIYLNDAFNNYVIESKKVKFVVNTGSKEVHDK